jgi:acyl-coenzyme A synthetase/AMP-(fatty) acid ligase
VVCEPDEVKGELAPAYVVLHKGSAVGAEALVARCREGLAPCKVPRGIIFVQDLPRNSHGKILRRSLRNSRPLRVKQLQE